LRVGDNIYFIPRIYRPYIKSVEMRMIELMVISDFNVAERDFEKSTVL
jgi:hypothetical protein